MATSNAMNTNNQYIKYTIAITQNSQNVTNNTSNVTVSVRFYRTNTGYESYGTGTVYCKINGVQYTAAVTSSQKITSSGIVLFTKTLNITHNADGTKALVTSAWINHSVVTSSEQSYSQTLTTIPRATTPTLSAASTEMGTTVTITMNRASSSFTHTLTYKFGNVTETIGANLTTSYNWTIPLDLARQIPNATSGTGTITCQTYNGSALIGTKSISFVATVPNTVVPVISSVAVTETVTSPNIANKFNGFVQGKSKIRAVTTAAGAYGSTIQNYKIYVRDSSNNNIAIYSGADITAESILISGAVKVVAQVTDSRGRSASYSQDITVLTYESPKISGFTAFRCNSDGTANYEGEYLNISLNFNISTVNNLNDKYYEVDYRVKGTTEWTVLVSNNIYSRNDSFITTNIFSGDNAYELKLQLYDFFEGASVIVDIPTAFTLVDFRNTGKGIAFGKVSEKDVMEVAMNSEFTGQMKIFAPSSTAADSGFIRMYRADGTLCAFLATSDDADGLNLHFYSGGSWAGVVKFGKDGTITGKNTVIEQGMSGIWTYRKWSDGTLECWGSRSIGNLDASAFTAWGSLVSATITAVDFPITFTAEPNLFSSLLSTGGAVWLTCNSPTTTSTGIAYAICPTATTINGVKIKYYAVGKWK